jgi:hypothetical protein
MTVPWGLVGPAFDYPTPYAAENRLLLVRGGLLLLLALVLTLLVSFRPEPESGAAAALLGTETELGSPVPMSLAAAFFAVLGVVNIVRASGQRRLLLEPGQPASLTGELLREASGASPGAAWLQRALVNGAPEPLAVEGPWRGVLLRLAPELGHWPRPLHSHLARRVYHMLLCAGLFGLLLPVWLLADGAGAALAALGLGAIAVGVVGASALDPARRVGGPLALTLWLLLGLLAAATAVLAAPLLPGQALLKALVPLALPVALASLLWGLLLVEGLALLAGRAQLGPVAAGRIDSHERDLNPDAELRAFGRELDLELHRRWAEGVPNRRHAWQMPAVDGSGERGRFSGVVLEESQPLLPAGERERPLAWPRAGSPEMWLAALGLLCLAWTLLGGAFWVWQGWTQLRDAGVYWTKAGVGLALVVAAGHALRVSHLLWSRFEVESTICWIGLQGDWMRLAPSLPANVHGHGARVAVAQARSVFYAAAEHRAGSRTLRSLQGDDEAARQWLQTLHQLSQTVAQAQPDAAERRREREAAAGAAARAAALAAQSTLPAAATAAPRSARYCAVCGTAVLAGARFCQHCGSALPQG